MRLLLLALLILVNSMSYAQDNDPVLFTVADDEIRLSEFKYIYEKNNSENADYSKESLEEYMELYSKFKLKVKRARSLGLDTVKVLKEELAGYRKQLAKSYLKDEEISERLINEVMERMMTDIEVQHIFVVMVDRIYLHLEMLPGAYRSSYLLDRKCRKSSLDTLCLRC